MYIHELLDFDQRSGHAMKLNKPCNVLHGNIVLSQWCEMACLDGARSDGYRNVLQEVAHVYPNRQRIVRQNHSKPLLAIAAAMHRVHQWRLRTYASGCGMRALPRQPYDT
jgi:hypothetical protein